MTITASVEGPAWCLPGLDNGRGRYPLGVESAVLSMVDKLVPGVSTLTQYARYYSLYWAIADFADEHDLDAPSCRTVIRRSEVAVAWAWVRHHGAGGSRETHSFHGVPAVRRRLDQGAAPIVQGHNSYSPRPWGFWSQYGGPSTLLGTVSMDGRALRRGKRPCPESVRAMFRPLLSTVREREADETTAAAITELVDISSDSTDVAPLAELMTAAAVGDRDPAQWSGNDQARRSIYRILARAVQLQPHVDNWTETVTDVVAYGDHAVSDPVLSQDRHTPAWRGLLLRRQSVGAWRRLFSTLVDHVHSSGDPVTKDDLHQWIRGRVGQYSLSEFAEPWQNTVDRAGNPLPVERVARETLPEIEADLAVLLIGARRDQQLSGAARQAFRANTSERREFLDPAWVDFQYRAHESAKLGDFASAMVDDMLAQARRVGLRKMRIDDHGRMTVFTKLHEREGRYFASGTEGSANVGTRIDQIGDLAVQLGLIDTAHPHPAPTDFGRQLLELPR